MRAVWRNTLRIAGTFPHERAERVNLSKLAGKTAKIASIEPEVRVFYHSPFMVLSRLAALSPPPLYVMQVTDQYISAAEDLDNLEAETYRRSNLHLSWGADPAVAFNAEDLYSPLTTVFKTPEGTLLDPPYSMAVLGVRLPKNPTLLGRMEDGRPASYYESSRMVDRVRDLLSRALAVARAHGHTAVVFGDLGVHCGHPPTQIAQLLQEALAAHPVPLVLVAAGDGKLGQRDPEYEELFRVLRADSSLNSSGRRAAAARPKKKSSLPPRAVEPADDDDDPREDL